MRKIFFLILITVSVFLPASEFVPNTIIIQLKEDASFSLSSKSNSEPQLPDSIKNLNAAYKVKDVEFLGNTEKVSQRALKLSGTKTYLEARAYAEKITDLEEKNGLNRFFKLTFTEDVDIPFLLVQYQNDPSIAIAEPNYIYSIAATTPNDTYFNNQNTSLPQISATAGWDITTGSSSVIVAVLDTGIDYTHEDLADNMWTHADYPLHGTDTVNKDNDPMDDHGHGTMVAGCIGAKGNNSKGIAGVAWNVQLMAVKVLDHTGSGNAVTVSDGIKYAMEKGAKIINMSLGSSKPSFLIETACKTAYDAGCLLVAASGNDGKDTVDYPAAHTYVIAVGATNPDNTRAYFSNYEYGVLELSAPGFNIYSTKIANSYDSSNGTSFSSPIVAGTAALLKANNSSLTNVQLRTILRNTAVDIGSPGYDAATGYGLVNIYNGLTGNIPNPQAFKNNTIYDVYNFPNPVKSNETKFSFKSEERIDRIEIYIYDLKGREKVRIEADFSDPLPGTYTTGTWDCRDSNGNKLPNGTYLYVIKSDSFKTPVKGKLTLLN